jgi:hypothetical protein
VNVVETKRSATEIGGERSLEMVMAMVTSRLTGVLPPESGICLSFWPDMVAIGEGLQAERILTTALRFDPTSLTEEYEDLAQPCRQLYLFRLRPLRPKDELKKVPDGDQR